MNIFGKKITEIGYKDIKDLVDGKIQESTYLDYKGGISSAKEAKAELGRDVSAFANTEGGTLVLGVDERRTKKDGKQIVVPVAIPGVPNVHNGQETRLWLEQVIKSTTKRMVNASIQPVHTTNNEGESVFVIYVPRSNHAPHMVWSDGSKHHGRYFKRRNFQNEIAEEYEVRELFERSARLEDRFREQLRRTEYGLRGRPTSPEYYYLSLVCCPTILEDRLIDVTKHEKLFISGHRFNCPSPFETEPVECSGEAQPSTFGLAITRKNDSEVQKMEFNIHRNGYVECVMRIGRDEGEEQLYVRKWVIGFFLAFLHCCTKVLGNFGYYGNVAVFLTISTRNVMFFATERPTGVSPPDYPEPYVRIMDEFYIGDLDTDLERTVRRFVDAFYQCFGHRSADCFEANGRYKPR